MKKYLLTIYALLAITALISSCTKEELITSGHQLPYEDEHIKLELMSAALPAHTRDLHFFTASTGIAITGEGKIFKTSDQGANWTLQYSHPIPDLSLHQILFTSPDTGYVVGGSTSCGGTGCIPPGGVILKTTSGGNHWRSVYQWQGVEFVSVAANSAGDLFAISNDSIGRISKSSNGGLSWTIIDSTSFQLMKITFHGNYGFCTGLKGKIISSLNNGTTWAVSATLDALYNSDIKFNSGHGFCIADNQHIYRTTYNGHHWEQVYSSDFSSYVLHPLTDSSCLAFGSGRYTGGDFGRWYGAIRVTKDTGKHWTETEFIDIEPIRAISFYSTTQGYAVSGVKLIKVSVQ